MNNTSDSNVKELKIDSTLWATPAKVINLLDFKPEKLSIKTENDIVTATGLEPTTTQFVNEHSTI